MNRVIACLLLLVSLPLCGAEIDIKGVRIWMDPDKTRLVLDTQANIVHKIFTLDGPDRVVLDLMGGRLVTKLPKATLNDPIIVGLRSGMQESGDLRIVLDLKQPVKVKSFVVTPNDRYGHRLVIDLFPRAGTRPPEGPVEATSGERGGGTGSGRAAKARDIVIAIDAGHGGEDPGAIGRGGTREKDVTLAIARRLAKLVDKEPRMRALLIRDGDYFVALHDRIKKAREQHADLFISIHADAFENKTARGSSVYTLSHGTASSEAAKWLASRENSADLIGGVDLSTSDDVLVRVLMDMTRNATIEHSTEAASAVLANLEGLGIVHKSQVQQAGFVVLKAPDIPSMLVETAFISNSEEEERLKNGNHQQQLARAILEGIRAYFRKYPPEGMLVDTNHPLPTRQEAKGTRGRQHVISPGDTLSGIAKRYQVSLSALRTENQLESDMVRVGQVLSIPEGT